MPLQLQKRVHTLSAGLKQHYRPALAIAFVFFLVGIVAEHVRQILPKPPSAASYITELELRRRTIAIEEFRTHWSVLLGIGGFIALIFLGYRSWAMHQSANAALEQSKIAQQGHITERFTRAIDQLGAGDKDNPKLEIRLGAIAALDHIARDSEDYFWTVMDVLTAYVRQNAPGFGLKRHTADKLMSSPELAQDLPQVQLDIRAVLTVLTERVAATDLASRERLDLSYVDFHEVDLIYMDFRGMNLLRASLEGAILALANLEQANLAGATLQQAKLLGAKLAGAKLSVANLDGADLSTAHLPGTDLTEAHLLDAKLSYANLEHADLTGAKLFRANLAGTSLFQANLSHTMLTAANFQDADLLEADLRGANLGGADLARARHLTQQQIDDAKGNEGTILPRGLQRPAHWLENDSDEEPQPPSTTSPPPSSPQP